MEKTFGENKIEFKDLITMKDFQVCSIATKQRQKDQDEIGLAFKLFPVLVLKINGEVLSDEQKRKWIEELQDLVVFQEICETIGELENNFMKGLDEKKKIG